MKKSTKYELVFLVTALSCAGLYGIVASWERWFPEFQVGMCVEHKRSGRLYQLIEDHYGRSTDTGVPARVLVTGLALPGEHEVGSVERISIYDDHLRPHPCP